jgi:hypothetical protein
MSCQHNLPNTRHTGVNFCPKTNDWQEKTINQTESYECASMYIQGREAVIGISKEVSLELNTENI